jgi:serine/threonine protein kinase
MLTMERDELPQHLWRLSYREQEVLKLRYGLGEGYVYSDDEIAHIFKMSPDVVQSILGDIEHTLGCRLPAVESVTDPTTTMSVVADIGRFQIIAKLGEGGCGETFRAWDSTRGVPVVLKRPLARHRNSRSIRARFGREIRRLLELAHQHIVPIRAHGLDQDGLPFLVMRFLPAGTLADRETPQSPSHLNNWLPAIAAALDYVHARGILHRDVKPANIFFDSRNAAFLGDFGIAKIIDEDLVAEPEHSLTRTGGEVGTYPYMGPEFFNKPRVLSGAYDQYALAITVYEMVCGRRPFSGDAGQLIVAHVTQGPPDIAQFRPDAPRSFCNAVLRALSKHPSQRFDTCVQFAEAALRDVAKLTHDPSVLRFLCPGCKRLVRVPTEAGGRSGRCLKCGASLRVSPLLDALWLEHEEPRGARRSADGETLNAITVGTQAVTALSPDQAAGLVTRSDRRKGLSLSHLSTIDGPTAAELAKLPSFSTLQLNGLGTLAADAADALSEFLGDLHLDGLVEIDPHTARSLARFKCGRLHLGGLAYLDAHTAKDLAGYSGVLVLNAITNLDIATARFLSRRTGGLTLGGLSSLDANIASCLSRHTSALTLDRLEKISLPAARALSFFGCRKLSLSGLVSLDAQTATVLAAAPRDVLWLNGLTTLDEGVAGILATFRGSTLCLDAVRALTNEVADALSAFKGTLTLRGLTSLNTYVAHTLSQAKTSRNVLAFHSLATLTPETALALAHFTGRSLSLNGLQTITEEIARRLSQYKHSLYLDGLTSMDIGIARAFSDFTGCLSLGGLADLDFVTAKSLAASRASGLYLGGITSLSTAAAEALAELNGTLSVDGLTMLNIDSAKALSGMRGNALCLDGLPMLTRAVAKELGRGEFTLSLNGLYELSDIVAQTLANSRVSGLDLDGLPMLSQDTARALAEFKGSLSLRGLHSLGDDIVTILAGFKGSCLVLGETAVLASKKLAILQANPRVHLSGNP